MDPEKRPLVGGPRILQAKQMKKSELSVPRHPTIEQKKLKLWRCGGLNPGPLTCKASALPLSYTPVKVTKRSAWYHTLRIKRFLYHQAKLLSINSNRPSFDYRAQKYKVVKRKWNSQTLFNISLCLLKRKWAIACKITTFKTGYEMLHFQNSKDIIK